MPCHMRYLRCCCCRAWRLLPLPCHGTATPETTLAHFVTPFLLLARAMPIYAIRLIDFSPMLSLTMPLMPPRMTMFHFLPPPRATLACRCRRRRLPLILRLSTSRYAAKRHMLDIAAFLRACAAFYQFFRHATVFCQFTPAATPLCCC